ncbi:MAG: hypothetical protein E3J78_02070 [Candidatus Cloacimonadota bacterium]|nr:MAG: hypothetical protein E3J78_02070 [Candidatus Cloacimonadota bacterium]
MNKKSLILGILAVIVFVVAGFFALTRSSPSAEPVSNSAKEIWQQTTISLNHSISQAILDFVIEDDNFVLSMYVNDIKSKIKGFNYLIVVNKEGKILSHPDSTQIFQDYNPQEISMLGENKNLIQFIESKNIYDIATPILLDDIVLGEMHLGITNPWTETLEQSGNNLPQIILLASAFIGLILIIFGAIGAPAAPKMLLPSAAKTEIEKLKKNKLEFESTIASLKKKLEMAKKQPQDSTGDEKAAIERLSKIRSEEIKLSKSIDDMKTKIVKLEQQKEAMSGVQSAASPDADAFKRQVALKDNEINNLKAQIENLKVQAEEKVTPQEVSAEEIEGMKNEELELTQRIVKKRREEIILSQRVESKRKEELALERKIEALKKNLSSMGS